MKKSLIALIITCVALFAAASYHFIPSVKRIFVVSEHPDIPTFIDRSMDKKTDGDIEKLKSLSEAGFTSLDWKIKYIEKRREYDSIYNGHRFISDGVLTELLKQFKLAYGEVANFTCEVPDKNLNEIKEFRSKHPLVDRRTDMRDGIFLVGRGWEERSQVYRDAKTGQIYRIEKNDFLIVAQSTCFTSTIGGYDPDGGMIVKDPIVLYKVEGGYIIVTSW